MTSGSKHWRRSAWLALVAVAGAACAPRPTTRPAARPATAAIVAGATVLLLPPAVRFEDMQSERPLTGADYDAVAFAAPLRDGARGAAAAAGAVVLDCGGAEAAAVMALCTALAPHAALLARGVVRPDSAALLARLVAEQPGAAALATAGLLRSGPGGYYNSSTGQIHAASASTVLSAALVGGDGRTTWKNDVLLRAIPEATDESYRESVAVLFRAAPPP